MTKHGIMAAGAGALVLAFCVPASADDIGRWGAWGRPPEHLKGGPASKVVSQKVGEASEAEKAVANAKASASEKTRKVAKRDKGGNDAKKPAVAVSPAVSPDEPAAPAEVKDASGIAANNESSDPGPAGTEATAEESAGPQSPAVSEPVEERSAGTEPPEEKPAAKSDKPERSAAAASSEAEAEAKPLAPAMVRFDDAFDVYSVVIDMGAHKLYYTLPNNTAFVYPVAIGKDCLSWVGQDAVTSIEDRPEPRRNRANPLGTKVVHVNKPQYRIHGTDDEGAVEKGDTAGCVAMTNTNVAHLANLIEPGTAVLAVPSLHSGPTPGPAGKSPADNI